MSSDRKSVEQLATITVDAILCVHRALGPGLLESAYQACLAHELKKRGLAVQCEVTLPVQYGEIAIEAGYRIDMLIDDVLIVENKSVTSLAPIHEAQLLTYLKLSGCRVGFLVNWNVVLIKDGIKRKIHGY